MMHNTAKPCPLKKVRLQTTEQADKQMLLGRK